MSDSTKKMVFQSFRGYTLSSVDVVIEVPSSKDIHWFGCTFSDLKFVFVSLNRKDSSISL